MSRPLAPSTRRTEHRTPVPDPHRSTLATELLVAVAVPVAILLTLLAISAPLAAASAVATATLAAYAARQALRVVPTTRRRLRAATERRA